MLKIEQLVYIYKINYIAQGIVSPGPFSAFLLISCEVACADSSLEWMTPMGGISIVWDMQTDVYNVPFLPSEM